MYLRKMLIMMLFLKNGNNLLNYFMSKNIYRHFSYMYKSTEFLLYKRADESVCILCCNVCCFNDQLVYTYMMLRSEDVVVAL